MNDERPLSGAGYTHWTAEALLASRRSREIPLRFATQMTHLTCPATVWRYVEGAVVKAGASLVMLDLEDSIPHGDDRALREGRDNVVRALKELDWGEALRFFRPRGLSLDPAFDDVREIITRAGDRLEGLIYPKVEGPEEVRLLDEILSELEAAQGLEPGGIRLEVLIESVLAEERLEEIASASDRLVGLIFGAFDYWSSLGLVPELYRPDHPLVMDLRCRLVKVAALTGIPAIAEMTLNYPTRDKSVEERRAALDECRRDAELGRDLGFEGKWVGIPAQVGVVHRVFRLSSQVIERSVEQVRAFQRAESEGRGAVMIAGRMADRATDRLNRTLLLRALRQGQLDREIARELGLLRDLT
jgi:citrate lyase subunit beta/citryl-CoA lyase